jgi:hypothetical protein
MTQCQRTRHRTRVGNLHIILLHSPWPAAQIALLVPFPQSGASSGALTRGCSATSRLRAKRSGHVSQLIGSTYRCYVSGTYNISMYLIRGCYTFGCHIINHASGFYVPSFHVTHILICADPVHATFPNAISICDGMSPTTHHALHRARKISCHNSRNLA